MEKNKKTIDDIYAMCENRYSLVNAISRAAREIADDAEKDKDVVYRKPVNMVIDRLLDGRMTIVHVDDVKDDELFADDDSVGAADDLEKPDAAKGGCSEQ